jgi:hypothetical protein
MLLTHRHYIHYKGLTQDRPPATASERCRLAALHPTLLCCLACLLNNVRLSCGFWQRDMLRQQPQQEAQQRTKKLPARLLCKLAGTVCLQQAGNIC